MGNTKKIESFTDVSLYLSALRGGDLTGRDRDDAVSSNLDWNDRSVRRPHVVKFVALRDSNFKTIRTC